MRNLLGFLIKISPLLLFLFLEAVAVVFMVKRSNYHNYAIISTSNVLAGGILDASTSVSSYFSLSGVNENLALENSELRDEISELRNELDRYHDASRHTLYVDSVMRVDSTLSDIDIPERRFFHTSARVIGNSVNKIDNYITLDKGEKDGVKCDMGVVCGGGVVGIVSNVSKHFCVVLPVINSKSKISCRVGDDSALGSLIWDGLDPSYAVLTEVPHHINVGKGDRVYTSGFSMVFPPDVNVGVVEDVSLDESNNFYNIKVKLSTSFYTLSYVDIVSFGDSDELYQISENGK